MNLEGYAKGALELDRGVLVPGAMDGLPQLPPPCYLGELRCLRQSVDAKATSIYM